MTETALITLILNICSAKSLDVKLECHERIVNCAIVDNGKILNLEQFNKKCLKKEQQNGK